MCYCVKSYITLKGRIYFGMALYEINYLRIRFCLARFLSRMIVPYSLTLFTFG